MAINKFFWIQNNFFSMHYLMSVKDSSNSNKTPPSTQKSKCCWM